MKKGPTGKERYIQYGLYEIYPLNWDQYKLWAKLDSKTVALMEKHNSDTQIYWPQKFMQLPLQKPAIDNLDNATAALINAFLQLHPINNNAARYYTNELYQFDNADGARKLHNSLIPAFDKFVTSYRNLADLALSQMDKIKGPELDYVALKNGKSWAWYGARERYYLLGFTLQFLRSAKHDKKQLKRSYNEYVANFLEITNFAATAPPPSPDFAGLISSANQRSKGMKEVLQSKRKRNWSQHMDVSGWF